MNSSSMGRKLLSGSALRMANLILAAMASLFLMPFIVHRLGDRIYGFWSLAVAVVGYYGLLDFGLSTAVSQYVCTAIGRKDPTECRAVFNAALRIQSVIGGVALLVTGALAGASSWICKHPADASLFWKVILILGVTTAGGFPAKAYTGLLDAQLRFDIQSCLGILGVILRTGFTVWVILRGGQLLALAWVTFIATVPVTILQIWFARREASWARIDLVSAAHQRVRDLLSYSMYTSIAMIADVLRFQIDPLVISAFIGLAAVTHYRVASAFSGYYVNIVIAAIGTFGPVMSRFHGARNRASLEKVFFFATKVSLLISVFIGLALVAWGEPFIIRWMGGRYDDAYWPLVVLAFAVLLDVSQTASISLLYSTFKHRFYTYINLAEGLINLTVSLLLARPLGILGVALGTLVAAFLIRIVIQPWWVCRVSEIAYVGYMKYLGGNLLRCSCLMIAATALVKWGLRPSYPLLVSSAACATLIYAVGTWWGVLNQEEREQVMLAVVHRPRGRTEAAAVAVAP